MVLSRANAKVAFDHIMDEVLGRDNESGLKKALLRERFHDVHSFCQITDEVIRDLRYDTEADQNVPVAAGDKGLLIAFIDYICYRNRIGEPIGDAWHGVTADNLWVDLITSVREPTEQIWTLGTTRDHSGVFDVGTIWMIVEFSTTM